MTVRMASALAAATLLATGCLPIPHTVTRAPAIAGRYSDGDGRPVAGARLALSTAGNDSTCTRPTQSTTSDAEGRFNFSAERRRRRFLLLFPDQLLCYTLCGGTGTDFTPGHRSCHFLLSNSALTLDCGQTVMAPQRTAPLECFDRPRPSPAAEERPRR